MWVRQMVRLGGSEVVGEVVESEVIGETDGNVVGSEVVGDVKR